jgi:hypothetical protein
VQLSIRKAAGQVVRVGGRFLIDRGGGEKKTRGLGLACGCSEQWFDDVTDI